MNLLYSFLTICMATVVIGLPQNYGSGREIGQSLTGKKPELPKLSEGCKIQYKTVYDIVEKDIIEKKCTEKYRKVFDVKYKTVCTPYQEEVCSVQYKNVCEAKYRDNCYEAYKEVQEPYVEDECVDKDIAVCDKHWQCTDPNEPLATCSDKVWVDNLEACKYLKKSFCTEVSKYRTIKEPYQKCDQIAYDECNDVPYDKCDYVTKESCQDHPYDHFYQVPYQDCQDVHKLVSEQVSQKKPFRICEGVEPHQFTDREIEDYPDIIDPFGRIDEINVRSEEDEEEFSEEKDTGTTKKSTKITFG